jgi:hypothetical protein
MNLNFYFELNLFSISFLFPTWGPPVTARPLLCSVPHARPQLAFITLAPPPPPNSLHPGCRSPSPLEADGAPVACSLFRIIPHRHEHPTSFSTAYDPASLTPATEDPFYAPVFVQAPPSSAIIGEYGCTPSLLSNGSMPHTPSLVRSCRSTLALSPATAGPSPSGALRRAPVPFCLAVDRPHR